MAMVFCPEMDRLHRSCRELIWLNPLLRFDGFEAKGGIRQMLPHVDKFLPIHNLQSMAGFYGALNGKVRGIARKHFRHIECRTFNTIC